MSKQKFIITECGLLVNSAYSQGLRATSGWFLDLLGRMLFCFLNLLSFPLLADLQDQSIPWTPSYLTARSGFSFDRCTASTKCTARRTPKYQGHYKISAAPFVDWGIDMSFMASSAKTSKLLLRAEKQLMCDLTGNAVSLTGVCLGSLSTFDRARNPVFFEMAAKTLEIGVGLGRHVCNTKSYYTQVFSYLKSGIGSQAARFSTIEIGMNHVYRKRHCLRASIEYLRTYPQGYRLFAGIATQKNNSVSLGIWYSYRFDSGVEVMIGCVRRTVRSHILRAAGTVQAQVSMPLAL